MYQMRPTSTDVVRSVRGLRVKHTGELCKTFEPIEMSFGGLTHGSKEPYVLDVGPVARWGGGDIICWPGITYLRISAFAAVRLTRCTAMRPFSKLLRSVAFIITTVVLNGFMTQHIRFGVCYIVTTVINSAAD